ncbi:adhesion G protein-coupled receptor F5-like isoform X2 [Mugil cephalus]|uniref:adhesion G protein-coupled receptor F5-like isoform X2 n=1 Tax=Mugil cephalus TaxID=48193 RepID=UPI001FB80E00|nr:adhesion G protein-coupled receptor F5-like isoform X2 [Mugil cephalus]
MALPKAVGYVFILLAMCCILEHQGNGDSLIVFSEEVNNTKGSPIHAREKRATLASSTDYELQAVISVSNGESLRQFLNNLSFPLTINGTSEITNIDVTTMCSSTMTGYQCRCAESFAWSYDTCIKYGACDAIFGEMCGCINSIPDDGQYCQPNISQTDAVFSDLVLDLRIPISSVPVPSNFIKIFTETLRNLSIPQNITPSVLLIDVNFTTWCYPNFTGGLQCQCQDEFAWSCGKCNTYGTCSNDARQTCGCINGFPSDGQFCEPVSSIIPCPVPTPTVMTDTTPVTATNSTTEIMTAVPNTTNLITTTTSNTTAQMTITANTTVQMPTIMVNTTTPMATTTTPASTTKPIMTTMLNTTIQMPTTLASPALPSTRRTFTLTLNMDFNSSLNDPSSKTFQEINSAIRNESEEHISTLQSAELISFISGSTIAIYNVSAASFQDTEIEALKTGLFTTLQDRYPILFDSSDPFKFEPTQVFFENSVNVTCGPPPENLNFGTDWKAEWKHNLDPIQEDENHKISEPDGIATLTVIKFSEADNGLYECRLIRDNDSGFRQKSSFNVYPTTPTNNGVNLAIQTLQKRSQNLNAASLPDFLDELSNITVNSTQEVATSPDTIRSIVQILRNVASFISSLNISISRTSMEDVLLTVGVLTTDGARESWNSLNTRTMSSTRSNDSTAESVSSLLLQSLETITLGLTNGTFDIDTPFIILNQTTFTDTFSADFNSSVEIDIPESDGGNESITVITFSSMDNVLPARDEGNSSLNIINGRVVLVQSSGTINNISLSFDVINNTLDNPKCVFWNFSFFDGLGGWDDQGCELVSSVNGTVTCNCNHLTSFSILMSPSGFIDPVLDYITYIGVGISIGSLVICLIIEAVIWRKIRKNNTSYLRHVSIVNIAMSLLIADIWFIIGAVISKEETNIPACTAATFFIHFFYLSLFFWMLASGLLLLYRTVTVFEGGLSKTSMLAIGFSLGYGAPIIIATITIAVTAPRNEYIQRTGSCWLNWSLAVLTPVFGLTWGLGVGILINPNNRGIHIAFAFFNSLQGFFILVFGTLLDKKVRSELTIATQNFTSGSRSTSAANFSSGLGFFRNWRRERDGYNVSSGPTSSDSFTNT